MHFIFSTNSLHNKEYEYFCFAFKLPLENWKTFGNERYPNHVQNLYIWLSRKKFVITKFNIRGTVRRMLFSDLKQMQLNYFLRRESSECYKFRFQAYRTVI